MRFALRTLCSSFPKDFQIPSNALQFNFSRSSGPGGQNVNKVNTKAEIRFHVMSANWIPQEVRKRLSEYQVGKINNDGELVITSQEQRLFILHPYPPY
jgi:peptidyl-tRNA hydrolase ICT1